MTAAIRTDGLTKFYGDTRGVEDLSFEVEGGEVFGFLGPNGAGKTTTIRTLMGFQSPTAGEATVLGADVTDRAALREARRRVGYLPAEPAFDGDVTGRRVLSYYGALRGDERSEDLLAEFDPPLDRRVDEYSRGNRQQLAIVVAFMHDPDLLVMDEPTSGLDPLKQERFLSFVRAERERGKTVFLSSHVLGEVRKVCDRVGIVREGRLAELASVDALVSRSGKTIRARIAGGADAAAFDLAGAHDVRVSEDDGATTVSFTYTGAYGPLLDALAGHDLLDLTVEEAPLEDVFMRFYGESAAEPGLADPQTGDGAGRDGMGGDRTAGDDSVDRVGRTDR